MIQSRDGVGSVGSSAERHGLVAVRVGYGVDLDRDGSLGRPEVEVGETHRCQPRIVRVLGNNK